MFKNDRKIGTLISRHGGQVFYYRLNPFRLRIVIGGTPDQVRLLANCNRLQIADLRNVKVGDDDVIPMLKNLNLVGLLLRGTLVSDRLVEALCNCSQLQYIGLQCTDVSAAAIGKLKDKLPDCIVWGDEEEADLEKRCAADGVSLQDARDAFSRF